MVKSLIAGLILACVMCAGAEAGLFRSRSVTRTKTVVTLAEGDSTATAEGVAKIMARTRSVGHWGGHHPFFEGCGMGATKEAAYNICCYANSGMVTVDVGYAQSADGTWYCCRRYSTSVKTKVKN